MRLLSVCSPDADGCYGDGVTHLLKPWSCGEALCYSQASLGVVMRRHAALKLKRLQSIESRCVASWDVVWSWVAMGQGRESHWPCGSCLDDLTVRHINRSLDASLLQRPYGIDCGSGVVDDSRHSIRLSTCINRRNNHSGEATYDTAHNKHSRRL